MHHGLSGPNGHHALKLVEKDEEKDNVIVMEHSLEEGHAQAIQLWKEM